MVALIHQVGLDYRHPMELQIPLLDLLLSLGHTSHGPIFYPRSVGISLNGCGQVHGR